MNIREEKLFMTDEEIKSLKKSIQFVKKLDYTKNKKVKRKSSSSKKVA